VAVAPEIGVPYRGKARNDDGSSAYSKEAGGESRSEACRKDFRWPRHGGAPFRGDHRLPESNLLLPLPLLLLPLLHRLLQNPASRHGRRHENHEDSHEALQLIAFQRGAEPYAERGRH